MVCDKGVCQRWCGKRWWVTKLCVKDGVCERWCARVCDKVVCEGWCVKDGVRQSGM